MYPFGGIQFTFFKILAPCTFDTAEWGNILIQEEIAYEEFIGKCITSNQVYPSFNLIY